MTDMIPDETHADEAVTFDFRTLSARDRYKLLIGTVTPRPIALVTTVDLEGGSMPRRSASSTAVG